MEEKVLTKKEKDIAIKVYNKYVLQVNIDDRKSICKTTFMEYIGWLFRQ
jgi:transcriptional regulator CtsR